MTAIQHLGIVKNSLKMLRSEHFSSEIAPILRLIGTENE
jgi:hypothetical protein